MAASFRHAMARPVCRERCQALARRSLASLVPSASAFNLAQAILRAMGARPQLVHGNSLSLGTNCRIAQAERLRLRWGGVGERQIRAHSVCCWCARAPEKGFKGLFCSPVALPLGLPEACASRLTHGLGVSLGVEARHQHAYQCGNACLIEPAGRPVAGDLVQLCHDQRGGCSEDKAAALHQ